VSGSETGGAGRADERRPVEGIWHWQGRFGIGRIERDQRQLTRRNEAVCSYMT